MLKKNLVLYVKVIPKSRTESVSFISSSEVRVKVTSPPEKGKANKRMIQLLASEFSVSPSKIKILKGHASRSKIVTLPRENGFSRL